MLVFLTGINVAAGGVSEYCMEDLLQAACSCMYEAQILCISTVV